MNVIGLALVEALWARMCEGTREDGTIIQANDPYWDDLQICAKNARNNSALWLDMKNIYGTLGQSKTFSNSFNNWLNLIWRDGVEKTLQTYLKDNK